MITGIKSEKSIFVEAILFCLGFILFSYFIHHAGILGIVSISGLIIPAILISRRLTSFKLFLQVFGLKKTKKKIFYIVIGLQLGLIYAIIYRNISGMSLFPVMIKRFAITAAIIGAAEELIFRGYIQEHFKKVNVVFALFYTAFAHSLYKSFLFLSPSNDMKINILFLLIWTFIGGVIFGLLKEISKSTIPVLLAHAFFDILVYGELSQPPWWVW